MTQSNAEQLAAVAGLQSGYPTPEITAQRLQEELTALSAAIRAAGAHWQTLLPEREWTPAQEAEHAILVAEGTGKVVRLLTSDKPIQRGPEVPITYRNGKRLAPEGTIPEGTFAPEDLLARLDALSPRLNVLVQPNAERTFFHPAMGHLDALTWLRMAAWHTRHHRKAIERGLAALAG